MVALKDNPPLALVGNEYCEITHILDVDRM